MLLGEPRYFLRAAIYLRAALRREHREFDTRIGVGLGEVARIDPARISLSAGDAFLASGRQLDAMSSDLGITVAVPERCAARLGWLTPMAALCSSSLTHWSERQAEIALKMLHPAGPRQIDVASMLAISKQAVSKTLTAIDFEALLAALRWVEGCNWQAELNRKRIRLI